MRLHLALRRIRKLLVANRGEIARRVFRTARDMGIATVAVHSDPDADAPFVHDADEAIAIGGSGAAESYLVVERIIEAASRSGADAVHPGYGFLSENARFASAVEAAGLVWVGPPPAAIAAMGDKLEAKKRAQQAGLPILPSAEVRGLDGAALAREGAGVGYPLLVKAAAGGGGKGMRIVRSPDELTAAVASASREAKSSFGDETVFLERYLEAPRHVEIQIFADAHGHFVHLFERECSIQRRHQKIVEESPSVAVDEALRERMGQAGAAIARAIDYRGAGTVEFLLDGDGSFYFLEVNTRLQVEHPVTEAITGLDLVREQLRVAMGEPLSEAALHPRREGHAIEVRLYAEDPANGFLPSIGRILAWDPPAAPACRFDSGVESGSDVSPFYDPMLAKVIAHAPTRGEAASRLARGIEGLRLHGVTTNRDLLVEILREPAFLAGDTTTDYLDRVKPPLSRVVAPATRQFALVAAALAEQERRRSEATVLRGIPSGWRNNPGGMQVARYRIAGEPVVVRYARERSGDFRWEIEAGAPETEGSKGAAGAGALPPTVQPTGGGARVYGFTVRGDRDLAAGLRIHDVELDLAIDGHRRRVAVLLEERREAEQVWVHLPEGEVRLVVEPRFPEAGAEQVEGGYLAPMPGKVIELLVQEGDAVTKGQVLVVLEAMKMEHRICAIADGVVQEVRVVAGGQVSPDDVLVVVA